MGLPILQLVCMYVRMNKHCKCLYVNIYVAFTRVYCIEMWENPFSFIILMVLDINRRKECTWNTYWCSKSIFDILYLYYLLIYVFAVHLTKLSVRLYKALIDWMRVNNELKWTQKETIVA
jgi:hypothetical protein